MVPLKKENCGYNRRKKRLKFPKLETLIIFVALNNSKMEQKPRFQVVYMQEAIEFLQSLNEKVRDKIVYRSLEPNIAGWNTDYLHSGTLVLILW